MEEITPEHEQLAQESLSQLRKLLKEEEMSNEKELTIRSIVKRSYEISIEKGWWAEPRDIPHILALIHSEVSEALEEYRKYNLQSCKGFRNNMAGEKPEGMAYELADIIIRVADLCGHYGIDLNRAISEKMEFNRNREYRHGNKHA